MMHTPRHRLTVFSSVVRSTLTERVVYLPLFAVVSLGIIARTLVNPLNHDSAWYLVATERWLDGAVLYRDIVEINPPLAFFLTAPAVELAELTGLFPATAFVLMVFGLIALSLALSWRGLLLIPGQTAALRNGLLFASFLALAVIPGGDFGQREHLMVVLAFPYLLLAAARAEQAHPSIALAVTVGVLAALGFGLKPYFLLTPLAIEAYLAWRGRGRWPLFRAETLALAAMLVAYPIVILMLTPQYLETIVPFGRAVYFAFSIGLLKTFALMTGSAILVLLLASYYVPTRKRLFRTALIDVFLLSSFCFLAIYWVQAKGWHYQLLPVPMTLLFAALSLLLTVLEHESDGRTKQRLMPRMPAVVVIVLVPLLLLFDAQIVRGSYHNSFMQQALILVQRHARGGSFYIFSSLVSTTYPLALYADARAASRYPTLWLLPGLIRSQVEQEWSEASGERRALQTAIASFVADSVIDDLRRDPPSVIIVDERKRKSYFGDVDFDYIEYFSKDPRFAAFWSDYRPLTRFLDHEVFVRRADAVQATHGMLGMTSSSAMDGD